MAKIALIDSPTERTTAATDALLAILALGSAVHLRSIGQDDLWKMNLWSWALGLLAVAAALGTVAHGFKMSVATNGYIWQALNLALGLVVALFVVGVTYDMWGVAAARRALPFMIGVGLLFFGVTRLISGAFLTFIIYQAVAMLFALGVYGWLAVTGQLTGAVLMVFGVLITMIAAGVQASKVVSFTLIWPFDHNGAYHLIQMVGVLALMGGLRSAFLFG